MELIATQTGELNLSPIEVNEDYLKKWNSEHYEDFVHLTRNGEVLNNNTLYRVGGIGKPDLSTDYFMLLRYTEDFYGDNITKIKSKKPHLKGQWCIIDKNGAEKVVFNQFDSPYLIKDSCIYSLKDNYFNVETGYIYANSYTKIESKNHIILGSPYSDIGECIKINKKTGEFEIID